MKNTANTANTEITTRKTNKQKILLMVQLAVFTAIEAVFCFTPLGSLPLGPGIVATLAHIPAIIVALTLGKKPALYMGFIMGLFSLIVWTFMPSNPLFAFCFTPFTQFGNVWSIIICIVPRTLMPFLTAIVFELIKDKIKLVPAAAVAAVVGSLLHSVMVLGLIYICFSGNKEISDFIAQTMTNAGTPEFTEAYQAGISTNVGVFLTAWGGVNAVFEAIIAGVVSAGAVVPLTKLQKTTNR